MWLIKRGLKEFVDVFGIEQGDNQRVGIEGEELLEMDMNRLFEAPFHAAETLHIKEEERQTHPLIERFFRELTKLELRTVDLDGHRETTINEYMEMKSRIKIFVRKWSALCFTMFDELRCVAECDLAPCIGIGYFGCTVLWKCTIACLLQTK